MCFTAYMFGTLGIHDFFAVSRAEFAVLLAFCTLVLSLEVINTAIEKAVDLAMSEINPLAKISKDAAAGAVLLAAIASVVAGITILWQPEAFVAMGKYYAQNIYELICFIASIVFSCGFVLEGPKGIAKHAKKLGKKQRYKK